MSIQAKESAFKFNGYKIIKSVIELDESKEPSNGYSILINPSGIVKGNEFRLSLDIIVKQDTGYYSANVIALGNFVLNENVEKLDNYCLVNSPAILFPYVRAYISALTALSGIDTIIIPTLNLISLKNDLEKNISYVK